MSQLIGVIDKMQQQEVEDTRAAEPYRIDTLQIADGFHALRRDILEHGHTEYVLPGGRGSTKSSFVSLMIIELMMNRTDMHVLVLRKVAATILDSVYSQMCWAIEVLGLTGEFRTRTSPALITRKATGQNIYFRGADDRAKLKSLKPTRGTIGIVWFEELDQFFGEDEVRSIEQSALRGCEKGWIFKTYNPPRSRKNWTVRGLSEQRKDRLVHHSTYRSAGVPKKWLGQIFLDRAAELEKSQPKVYEHEYGGISNSEGGTVFENIVRQKLTDEEIAGFDRIYNGVDWGWYPDPWVFNRAAWMPAQRRLVIFAEKHLCKHSNAETGKLVLQCIGEGEAVVCDSAEPKSIEDWRALGLRAQAAKKGPGSIEYSVKWLQSLKEIVIDPERCPQTLREFEGWEYEAPKDGSMVKLEDRDNHHIDAVRYATERIWRRRGQ